MKFRDVNHQGTGNIIINEHNNETLGKPLPECTNEQLLEERKFRLERLEAEKNQKYKEKLPSIICSILICIGGLCFGFYKTQNISDLITWSFGLPGAILAILMIQDYFKPNKYEQKHLFALQEIKDILTWC